MELSIAKKHCEDLLKHYGLDIKGWKFGRFTSAVRTLGTCKGRNKTIDLSTKMTIMRSDDDVKMTILHEVAHARDNEMRGHSAHDKIWRNLFISMGGNGKTRTDIDIEIRKQTYKYISICPVHGEIGGRTRMPRRPDSWHCKLCKNPIKFVPNTNR